jgi:hypothetical protein
MQRKLYLESMPVVLDPELRMAIDVFPCEDGHAQEPSLCESVLQTVKADQLWIADHNMCTQGFLFGISIAVLNKMRYTPLATDALCPMPYALCPMPARAPRVTEKGYTASSDFLIREHKTLPQQAISELQFQGDVETGAVE